MQPTKTMIHNALAGLVALGLSSAAASALAAKGDTEKCAGIVKAGELRRQRCPLRHVRRQWECGGVGESERWNRFGKLRIRAVR